MKPRIQTAKKLFVLIVTVCVIVGGVCGWWLGSNLSARSAPLLVASEKPATKGQVGFSEGFAPILRSTLQAVVNISSSRIVKSPHRQNAPEFFDFFGRYFGDEFFDRFDMPRERRVRTLGSGVIVSSEGYLLTNEHVIRGASEVEILLSDKHRLKGKLVGSDPLSDIAVLKLEKANLPVLALGDSSAVEIGEFALAIGNPFGVGQTVTVGIVSATGRGGLNIERYEDFIQTDAAINPGNSGGALINVEGELIGINTAIVARGGMGNQGVGFAVPTNMARHVMEQILEDGKVIRGYLGVRIQNLTPELAKSFGLQEANGALVADVSPDTPAARAGILRGDVIVEVNGEKIVDSRRLSLKISQTPPDTRVHLKLLRDSREREVYVTLGELPGDTQRRRETEGNPSVLKGVTVEDLTPAVARQLDLAMDVRGVVVTKVESMVAAEAGLRRGDVIQEVNRRSIASVAEFREAVQMAGSKSILLLINRRGQTTFLVVEPE